MTEEKQIYTLDYLGFAAGVRLHWSDVRQEHWLLFPEGAIALNSTAVAILTKCDGYRSFEAIALILKQQFSDVNLLEVQNLLFYLLQRGLLTQVAS
jgi:pyrroloquinoline quinone biosynthesis protein D